VSIEDVVKLSLKPLQFSMGQWFEIIDRDQHVHGDMSFRRLASPANHSKGDRRHHAFGGRIGAATPLAGVIA
jgi:hypothetical protein